MGSPCPAATRQYKQRQSPQCEGNRWVCPGVTCTWSSIPPQCYSHHDRAAHGHPCPLCATHSTHLCLASGSSGEFPCLGCPHRSLCFSPSCTSNAHLSFIFSPGPLIIEAVKGCTSVVFGLDIGGIMGVKGECLTQLRARVCMSWAMSPGAGAGAGEPTAEGTAEAGGAAQEALRAGWRGRGLGGGR